MPSANEPQPDETFTIRPYPRAAMFGTSARIVRWYNEDRLHLALGFLRPIDYYRGDPAALSEPRRRKMADARHRRQEKNLKLRQPTLPLEP